MTKGPFEHSYTPKQIAEICGVKTSTVYAWISRNELKAHRFGRNRRINQFQLSDFLSHRSLEVVIDMTN